MCEPVTITAIALGVTAAGAGGAGVFGEQANKKRQQQLSADNAQLQRSQVRKQLEQETEANAQRAFELSRQAIAARGTAKNLGLGDRSVRAIGRAIGFELGQDKATLQRNQEIASETASARLRGIDITRASEELQIGGGPLELGLGITSAVLSGVSTASAASGGLGPLLSGLGVGSTPAAPTPTTGNRAAVTQDSASASPGFTGFP